MKDIKFSPIELIMLIFLIVFTGIGVVRGYKIAKLEQKLCQLKQLEYCTKKQ
jgi:hypothetical protein